MKNTHNFKFVVFEFFFNSKYNFQIFKISKSFVRCEWAIMCMTYEQSFSL
jgi:hypothetical protein